MGGLHLNLSLGFGGSGAPLVLDPDAEALIAAMTPTPDAGRQVLINNLILQLKADGIWTLLDLLYVFAAHAQQPGTLNWKSPAAFVATPAGSPTFTVDRGFTGNGTTAFLAPGWGPTDGVQYQQNSAHASGWSLTAGAASSSQVILGTASGAAPNALIRPRGSGDQFSCSINDALAATTIASTNMDGFFVINRSGASARQGYRNGASLGSDTEVSTGESTSAVTFLRNTAGTFATLQVACGSVGASLNAGQVSDFYDALLTYLQAVVPGIAPGAPTLEAVGNNPTNDPTPDLDILLAELALEADVITIYDNAVSLTAHTVTAAEAGGGNIVLGLSPLSDGVHPLTATHARNLKPSPLSNTLNLTIDTTAPTLSSPTGAEATDTTADLSVSTNQANGTLYYVVTASGTPPTAAQVKLGQDHLGAAALYAGNQVVSSTGTKNATAINLTSGTRFAHFMHEDAATNQSAVATSASWVQTGGFSPADLSPNLWLAASDLTTLFQLINGTTAVTTAGQVVGTWNDKSGNAFNLTATADDTTRPIYQTTDFQHVSFDGTNDKLRRTAALGMYAAGACSIFLACRPNPSTSRVLIGECDNNANATFYEPICSAAADANDWTGVARNDASSTLIGFSNVLLGDEAYDNTDMVIGIIDNGSNLTTYKNGTQLVSTGYTRAGTFNELNTFEFFSRFLSSTASAWFAGRCYEVVVVNRAIDATERANLTTYLGNVIGLSI